MGANETLASGLTRGIEDYLGSSLSIGRDWLDALPGDDPRRTGVVAMAVLVADWKQSLGEGEMADDFQLDLQSMLCQNCGDLHPGLASLCRGQSLDCCWLLKGYRCRVSPPSMSPPSFPPGHA